VVDVQTMRIPEVVSLLGEQLDHCGAPSLSITTGRDLIVKARPRDDDTVNTWIDGRRSSLPPAIAAALDDHGIGSAGVDVVVESGTQGASGDDGFVLLIVSPDVAPPPDRREECERAAAVLGLEHLAQAGPDAVLRLDDETLKARTRHVITETARVRAATRSIESGAWEQLGTILTASHASLRDDFEVSCAELDVAAEAALEAGALGARMGLALVPTDRAQAVRELVERRFDGVGWPRPAVSAVEAVMRHGNLVS
jgi:galactokinase